MLYLSKVLVSEFRCYVVPVFCILCLQFLPSNAQYMADEKMAASGHESNNDTNTGAQMPFFFVMNAKNDHLLP